MNDLLREAYCLSLLKECQFLLMLMQLLFHLIQKPKRIYSTRMAYPTFTLRVVVDQRERVTVNKSAASDERFIKCRVLKWTVEVLSTRGKRDAVYLHKSSLLYGIVLCRYSDFNCRYASIRD